MKSKLVPIVAVVIFYLPFNAVADPVDKIDICHKAGTNAERILNINPDKDGPKHFGHGDTLVEAEICDGLDSDCDGVIDNETDGTCYDAVACTDDTCGAGACSNVPNDANCSVGETCDAVAGCQSTSPGFDFTTCPCTVALGQWTNLKNGEGEFAEGTDSIGSVAIARVGTSVAGIVFPSFQSGAYCAVLDSFPGEYTGFGTQIPTSAGVDACKEVLENVCDPGENIGDCIDRGGNAPSN